MWPNLGVGSLHSIPSGRLNADLFGHQLITAVLKQRKKAKQKFILTLIPKYGAQVMRALTQDAGQGERAARLHIQVHWTQDMRLRFC